VEKRRTDGLSPFEKLVEMSSLAINISTMYCYLISIINQSWWQRTPTLETSSLKFSILTTGPGLYSGNLNKGSNSSNIASPVYVNKL
jgi:hypothetical protein